MRLLLLFMAFLLTSFCASAQDVADSVALSAEEYVCADSVWTDSVTGFNRHLQRLCGEDTLVIVKPNPFKALAEDLGVNATILAWDYYVQNRGYARISRSVIKRHFKKGFVWDNDSFSGNQFSHPYHGAMFYNAAREHGLSYGVSLVYPVLGSATWEMFCETNAPAINDLLSTGIGGAALGEVAHRASDIFFDDSRTGFDRIVREVIGSALNPVRAVHRLFSGEMWRVRAARGKRIPAQPYNFNVSIGNRLMVEHANGERNKISIPFVAFDFDYGDRFTKTGKTAPFEFFKLSLMANMANNNPSVADMNILGRIASRQYNFKDGWNMDVGFYQTVKYVDHYGKHSQFTRNFPIISEAVSFGCGVYAERKREYDVLSSDFLLNLVVLGGSNSDHVKTDDSKYMPFRRYNFGSGFSVRHKLEYRLYKRFSVGNDVYFMQLFVPSDCSPEEMHNKILNQKEFNMMGDRGGNSIVYNKAYLSFDYKSGVKINFTSNTYFRHSVYKYYPSVKGRSQEWRVGLSYSL